MKRSEKVLHVHGRVGHENDWTPIEFGLVILAFVRLRDTKHIGEDRRLLSEDPAENAKATVTSNEDDSSVLIPDALTFRPCEALGYSTVYDEDDEARLGVQVKDILWSRPSDALMDVVDGLRLPPVVLLDDVNFR